jgi:hypothetical protein
VSFHLIPLELGGEAEMLERALEALDEVEPGETAFLPEYLAWTPHGAGVAFARLVSYSRQHHINVVTTLDLGHELVTDLPGADLERHYNAVAIFTQHGAVHIPQAKVTTQSFETDPTLDGPGIGVTGYARINRVKLDVDEEIVTARFLVGSDLALLGRFSPREWECDLLVVMGNFPRGAEKQASRMLGLALKAGVTRTVVHVNAFQARLMERVEEVLDTTRAKKPSARWSSGRSLRSGFYLYPDQAVRDFKSMSALKARRGRIPLPRSRWEAEVTLGEYPVTVVL